MMLDANYIFSRSCRRTTFSAVLAGEVHEDTDEFNLYVEQRTSGGSRENRLRVQSLAATLMYHSALHSVWADAEIYAAGRKPRSVASIFLATGWYVPWNSSKVDSATGFPASSLVSSRYSGRTNCDEHSCQSSDNRHPADQRTFMRPCDVINSTTAGMMAS